MAATTPQTLFTRDIVGRYLCNTFQEATQSGPFDVIIVGGGTFGLALAQDLHFRSAPGSLTPPNVRILVLEAGPFSFREHVQDLPNFQINSPGVITGDGPGPIPTSSRPLPSTLDLLTQQGLDRQPLYENWGLPWRTGVAFGGLAYTLGGRSLYWGGWSPQYFDSEMHNQPVGSISPDTLWPQTVIDDLKARYFAEAADQCGVSSSNAFINGSLQDFYRQALFQNYSKVSMGVPLAEYPDYVARYIANGDVRLAQQIASPPYPNFATSVRLDAPLAVQILSRPGFFPFCKFSSVPLAMTAARDAANQSAGDDTKKRLMIVPNCHVTRLITGTYTLATGASIQQVTRIETSDGAIDLNQPIGGNPNRRPVVVLALGAIESARVVLNSISGVPNAGVMGSNLMVHLRKNVPFQVALPSGLTLIEQQLSALIVRCRTMINGTPAHFHLQITANAVPSGTPPSVQDPLLFQNVPDIDHIRFLRNTPPGKVSVIIRAVGEMLPTANNRVTVAAGDTDEYTMPRAQVSVQRSPADVLLMKAIDTAIDEVATKIFGNPQPLAANFQPDGLGTTFHESGTLRMGDDPSRAVVNSDSQFHYVTNLYAGDASMLPTCGSANPVMNGIAIRRRLAKRLVPEGEAALPKPGTPGGPVVAQPSLPAAPPVVGTVFTLFDGTSLQGWRMAGRGSFHLVDGALQSVPSLDLGLLWHILPMPQNYRLELDFLIRLQNTNSGIFVRFTNPELSGFANPAWDAVQRGFEIQIDNSGAGQQTGLDKHRTGAVYGVNYPGDPSPTPGVPPATPGDFVTPKDANLLSWNQYRIEVVGDVFTVWLNGIKTAKYTNPDPNRGIFSPSNPTFVGLQSYSNYSYTTAFRNIRVTTL